MVSILVPVYNSAPYLKECVESLVGQTYRDLQIVMIDDGSSDGSWAVMKELARMDRRIEIYSQRNHGVATTRNQLLDKVRGDFVLFVDSDDWIDLDTIEVLMQEQQADDYDIVMYRITANSEEDRSLTQEQAISLFLEHKSFRGSLCDKLIRSSLFEGLKIDENVSYGEDALMVWQVLQRINKMRMLGRVFYHYRVNPASLSRQPFNGKKLSAYTAWDAICHETDSSWRKYSEVAHGRFACEMTQILRDAAHREYKRDAGIKLLQEEVRRDGASITRAGISSWKMRAYAWLVSHHYRLACFVTKFIYR